MEPENILNHSPNGETNFQNERKGNTGSILSTWRPAKDSGGRKWTFAKKPSDLPMNFDGQ